MLTFLFLTNGFEASIGTSPWCVKEDPPATEGREDMDLDPPLSSPDVNLTVWNPAGIVQGIGSAAEST
jgi:hypothetical protein